MHYFHRLRSKHGLLGGDNILQRNLRGRSANSSGLINLLSQSGGSGNLGRVGRRNGLVSRRRGKLRLLGRESRVGVLRHVDLLARRSLALEEILDFAAVIANVLLADVGNLLHLLRSNALDLGSLVVDELGSVVELLVDELLVGSVDQRHNKGNSGTNEGKTPDGNELYKVVRDESSDESLLIVSIMKCFGYVWNLQQRTQQRSRQR